MSACLFDPLDMLVRFDSEGRAEALARSPEVWRRINRAAGERVLGMSQPSVPADLHPDTWEMHPEGDEFLHLVSGAIDVMLDREDGEDRVSMAGGQSCIVQRGTWHRLLLKMPSRLLFVTPAGGTRMRPWRADK